MWCVLFLFSFLVCVRVRVQVVRERAGQGFVRQSTWWRFFLRFLRQEMCSQQSFWS